MSRTVTITAFADDVMCLNAHSGDKLAWIGRDYGITGPIGPPLSVEPLVPRTKLYAHEATLSAEGYKKLLDARSETTAKLLRLTAGEAFGVALAYWRDYYGSALKGLRPKGHERSICIVAAYKVQLAQSAGDAAEAARL